VVTAIRVEHERGIERALARLELAREAYRLLASITLASGDNRILLIDVK
jgi:hypothetical protein